MSTDNGGSQEVEWDSPTPCWELVPRFPKFCASLANGHGRCRKGRCFVVDEVEAK